MRRCSILLIILIILLTDNEYLLQRFLLRHGKKQFSNRSRYIGSTFKLSDRKCGEFLEICASVQDSPGLTETIGIKYGFDDSEKKRDAPTSILSEMLLYKL